MTDQNGLYYMRARYYNVSIKRFLNRDTVTGNIGDSPSLNHYAYAQGNAINQNDPFGLSPDINWGAIASVLSNVAHTAWEKLQKELNVTTRLYDIGKASTDVVGNVKEMVQDYVIEKKPIDLEFGSKAIKAGLSAVAVGANIKSLSGLLNGRKLGKLRGLKKAGGTEKEARKVAGGNGDGIEGNGQGNSIFEEIFDTADNYKLSDDTFNNHILDRHGPNSTYGNKSHFDNGFDIKKGIDETLKSDKSIVKPNTSGRDGSIFEQTFTNPIGKDAKGRPINTLKVVIDSKGNVITAFPKK